MTEKYPRAKSIATNESEATTAWPDARDQLAAADRYWLATVRADGRPHVMPLFGVWLDDSMYFTAGPNTQKAVNLARNPHCVVATVGDNLDLIVEGEAERVSDQTTLRRVADAYDAKYGWPLTIRSDGAFDAPYGAPSAGPPPYLPHRLTPTTAFGLGIKEPYGATRWRFSRD